MKRTREAVALAYGKREAPVVTAKGRDELADAIIAEGRADLVLLGRELLRDPHWPHRAWTALKPDTPAPIAREYAWALPETRR